LGDIESGIHCVGGRPAVDRFERLIDRMSERTLLSRSDHSKHRTAMWSREEVE
jgi:hypothetical protein